MNNFDIKLYHEKLNNGLEIYIVPKNDVKNIIVKYTTKFGSTTTEFVPKGETKMIKVPDGIAHFLEHKMFEESDNVSVFEKFDKNGADCNAFTNYIQTTYHFNCPSNFYDNLNILLDSINNPYFTDQNVEKEKGIIIQEIEMYSDNPFRKGMDTICKNAFSKYNNKVPIGGTIESVKSITKEDLYKCYNTFYNPSNMFIVITGNVNPEETIKFIKKKMNKYKGIDKIKIKQYNEPKEVVKKIDEIKMNVTIPKIMYGIKIDYSKFNPKKFRKYFFLLVNSIFGDTSDINEILKDKNISTYDIDYSFLYTKKYVLFTLIADSKKPKELIDVIKKEMKKIPSKEVFERKKKCYISSIIKLSDSIEGISNTIMNNVITYNKFDLSMYNDIKGLNYKEFKDIVSKLDYSNNTTLYINPKK